MPTCRSRPVRPPDRSSWRTATGSAPPIAFVPALAVVAVCGAFAGAGDYSLDNAFGWSLSGEEWGIAATVISLTLGTAAVATRSLRLPQWRDRRQAA